MITRNRCIETEVTYSDDEKYRYILKKVWDKNLSSATFIGINPSDATELIMDKTVMNLTNHLIDRKDGYGSVNIVNLYAYRSKDQQNLKYRSEYYEKYNISYIKEALENSPLIIVGWGRSAEKNSKYREVINKTKAILSEFENIKCFQDGNGNINCHLSIGYNRDWKLVKYEL